METASSFRMLNSPKMELLRQIWDDSCDTILKGTIEKYAWDWEDHIVKALHNQLLSEKLHAIDEVCNDTLNLYRICERRVRDKLEYPSTIASSLRGLWNSIHGLVN